MKPITPEEALREKETSLPNFVIEAFNKAIVEKYSQGTSTVLQDRVIEIMRSLSPGLLKTEIFEKNYLDVETVYRKNGWDVEYDKPGFDENYEPRFIFKAKK